MPGATALKDDNAYPAIYGLSCVDGVTPIRIKFNSTHGGMLVNNTIAISVTPTMLTATDGNDQPVAKGISSSDSSVVLPWYVDPATGAVLVDF